MELTRRQRIKLAEAALRYAKKLNPNRDVQPKKQAAGHCYDVEDLHAVGAVHAKPQHYPQG